MVMNDADDDDGGSDDDYYDDDDGDDVLISLAFLVMASLAFQH